MFTLFLDPVKRDRWHTCYRRESFYLLWPGCAQPWHYPGEPFCNAWIGVTTFCSCRVKREWLMRLCSASFIDTQTSASLVWPYWLVMGVDTWLFSLGMKPSSNVAGLLCPGNSGLTAWKSVSWCRCSFADEKGAIIEMWRLFTYSRGSVRQQDHEHAKLQVAAAVEANWYCKFVYWYQ